ncbi:MAG: hypothetical protein U9N33_10530 [Campylobacterota bacterium]|nr:hypothetical protein [Campylobacterota bacterium]
MEDFIYPASLAVVVLLSYKFWQNHNTFLLIIALGVGVYIIYSHETGDTATNWKNSMVESINESAEDFVEIGENSDEEEVKH